VATGPERVLRKVRPLTGKQTRCETRAGTETILPACQAMIERERQTKKVKRARESASKSAKSNAIIYRRRPMTHCPHDF